MFFISKDVHAFEYELEEGLQVLWARTCHEDVRIPMGKSSGDRQTQCRRLPSSASSSQGYRRAERFICDGIHECQNCLRLIKRAAQFYEFAHGFRVCKTRAKLRKLPVSFRFTLGGMIVFER